MFGALKNKMGYTNSSGVRFMLSL